MLQRAIKTKHLAQCLLCHHVLQQQRQLRLCNVIAVHDAGQRWCRCALSQAAPAGSVHAAEHWQAGKRAWLYKPHRVVCISDNPDACTTDTGCICALRQSAAEPARFNTIRHVCGKSTFIVWLLSLCCCWWWWWWCDVSWVSTATRINRRKSVTAYDGKWSRARRCPWSRPVRAVTCSILT